LHAANDEASKVEDGPELSELSTSRPALTSNQQSTNTFTSIGLAAVYIGLVGARILPTCPCAQLMVLTNQMHD
jgi:hypothetical protein